MSYLQAEILCLIFIDNLAFMAYFSFNIKIYLVLILTIAIHCYGLFITSFGVRKFCHLIEELIKKDKLLNNTKPQFPQM